MAGRMTAEQRRVFILDEAMSVIDADGHRGLTMAALARRCDMSVPGVMHYFADMPSLLVALVARRDERDWSHSMSTVGDIDVRATLDQMVDNIVSRPHAARLFAAVEADALDPAHPGHGYFRDRMTTISGWLADRLGGPQHRALAERIFAAMDGLQLHFLRDPDHMDLPGQWRAVADALLPPD